jgi:hypothetical protein
MLLPSKKTSGWGEMIDSKGNASTSIIHISLALSGEILETMHINHHRFFATFGFSFSLSRLQKIFSKN